MNQQLVLIIAISCLTALSAAGAVWFGVDLGKTLGASLAARRAEKARLAAEKAAADEKPEGEGEKIF